MKTITSPVARFPGTVVLHDPLTLPQAIGMERAMDASLRLDNPSQNEINYALMPGICGCVAEWHLDNLGPLTPDTFPASPKRAAAELMAWLVNEVIALYKDAEEVPNG